MVKSRWAYAVIASLTYGCGGGGTDVLPIDETGGDDTSITLDTAVGTDTATEDTGSSDDTSVPSDTGTPGDTSTADSGTPDDTSIADTGTPMDTSTPTDTGTAMDTSTPVDTGMPDTFMCTTPSKMCGSACINVSTDVDNCGDCGTKCPTAGLCAGGTCACPITRSTLCGSSPGLCTNTQTDNNNCGTCGNVCPTGKICSAGVCTCSPGLVNCTSGCKDLSSDVTACGSCTNACATGASCTSGACSCPLAKPDICGGACVDKKTDNNNCGACGVVCATGATCSTITGVTACRCPAGQIVCGGACVDPSTSTSHCGGCGLTCTGGTCSGGTCACPTGQVYCGGACKDLSSDPNNCGMCGRVCSTGTCSAGVCPVPACKTGVAPKVLFYGTTGSTEQPFLPPGAIVTVAAETTWRSMTRAQFESYDIIVIGQPSSGAGPTSAQLQALYETRATWGAAVAGRVAVLGLDPGFHAASASTGAQIFARATFSWLAQGPTARTALYVSSDWDARNLDFLSPLGTFSASMSSGDTVTITETSHPTMIGSTSASLSSWGSSFHSFITGYPTTYRSIATGSTGTATGSVVVVHDEACTP